MDKNTVDSLVRCKNAVEGSGRVHDLWGPGRTVVVVDRSGAAHGPNVLRGQAIDVVKVSGS